MSPIIRNNRDAADQAIELVSGIGTRLKNIPPTPTSQEAQRELKKIGDSMTNLRTLLVKVDRELEQRDE